MKRGRSFMPPFMDVFACCSVPKHLLSSYYTSTTVLGAGDLMVSKIDLGSELPSHGQTDHQQMHKHTNANCRQAKHREA